VGKKLLEIRLLGRFEVLRGQPVELPPSKKARALLAYLVATERAHDRDRLAGLLWDEREDARAALRWALSRLRPVVDDQVTRLTADRDRVGFESAGADVDLASVRLALRGGIDRVSTATLEQAAARFRGELLEGLDLSDCYGFHAWCIAEREAARALRASILTTIVDRLADDPERALPYARARLDLDPLAGSAQASVVRILGKLGRAREAEELYRSFEHLVHTRLGQRASGELERARFAIRHPAASAKKPAAPQAVAETAAATAPLARLARSPFVGRERELGLLTEVLDAALSGGGSFCEIAGEAGMGKSRLVEELIHQARLRGARVLVGRCLEGDGSPAFLPFLDSLDAALRDESDLARLVGEDAALAARLFPQLASRLSESPAPIADATSERYLVFHAVATLLDRIAAPAGALLVVEDLHWIDQPSLALLRYLSGRLDGMRLLVVATYREEDLDARQRDALADLRRQGGSRVLLRGLERAHVHALIEALGGSDTPSALREQLADATGGHPLFVQEMLKHLIEENAMGKGELAVPESVRQVIGRRLARLSDRAKRLLTVVSPAIGAVGWELVRELSKHWKRHLAPSYCSRASRLASRRTSSRTGSSPKSCSSRSPCRVARV
jgi:DNA-binding SARP family transcriptional activator